MPLNVFSSLSLVISKCSGLIPMCKSELLSELFLFRLTFKKLTVPLESEDPLKIFILGLPTNWATINDQGLS